MESFLGNAKSYYQSIPSTGRTYEGAPLPTTSGTVVTVASTNFQYGIAAPLQAPVTTRALPAAVAPPKPYSSNVITPSHHSLYSPSHTSGQVIPQYSSEGLPYPPQSSRLFSNSPSQQSSHSSISPYASGSHNPVQHSYAPTHSRPPDFTRGKVDQRNPSISRSLEVTRVGPAHTFSSISPENSQTIMSRPNAAHSLISGSHKSEYRLPPENPYLMQRQNYMSNSQRSIASQHAVSSRNPGAPHSSSKGATHNPPTLIKAEEPTTLSAAHFQPHQSHSKPGSSGGSSSNSSSCNNKRFETATAPVPYALAKRSEDSFFAEKLEESYACIKRVENPYAIGKTTSESVASTLSVTGEVEIRRQRNEAYFLKTYHPSDYSQMNGTRESHHHNSPENAIPKDFNKKLVSPDEAKSDIVLDLSVKTVRQTADSTAPEPDYTTGIPPAHNNYQSGNNLTISSRSPTPSSNTQNEKLCSPQIGNAYGYIKPPIMTPPQFAQLTAQDNGIPSSSSRHPTLKRPGDSTPSWEHLSKAPKMDPSIAMRAKSPYPAASITHHTKEAFKSSVHSSCIDSSRDAEIYNTVVKNEPVYPGFTDRASPYDTRMYNDPYKQWSSLYKSKSQTFTSKGERIYNPPLGHDVKSETLASQMVKKSQDSRYPYPQLNESNPNPIVNPNLYYNMDYLSNPSYNLATTTKGKLSTGDYYNHYLTSTQEDRLKDSTATPISDERISKSGSGTAEISKEIRVKTESEINSCIPICTPSSMHYSSDNRPSYHSPLNSNPVTKPHTNNLDLVESLNKASESISENFKKAIDFTQFDKRLSECSAQPNSVDSKTHEKSTTSETGKLVTSEVQNISHDCTSPIKLKESANLISETCSEFKKEGAEMSKETVNEAIRSIGSSSNQNESDHCKEDIRKDTIINKDEFSMENDKTSSGATSENIKENENSKQEEFVTNLENKDLSNSIDKPPTVKDDSTNKSVSEHEAFEEGEKDSEASHKVHKSSEMKLEIAGNKVEQKQDEDKKLPLESSPKVINNDEKITKEEIEGPSNSEQKAVNKQSSLNDCETDGNAEKELKLKENENDVEKSNTKLTSTLKLDKDEQGNQIKLSTSETSEKISEIPESKETKVSSPSKLQDVSPENKETEEERSDVPVPNKKQIEKTILPLSDKKNDQMIQDNINNTKATPNAASNCIEMEEKEKLHQENNKIMEKDEEDSVIQSKSEELSVDSKTKNSLIGSCENQIDLSNLSNKHDSSKRSPSPPMEEEVAAKLLDRHDKVKDISTEDKDKNCSKEREENNYCAAKLKGNSSCSPNIFKEHLMQMAEKKPSPETSSTESKNGEPEQYSSKSENEQLAEKGNVGNDKSLKMVPYIDKVNVTEAQVSGPRDPSNSHLNVTENLTVATKTTDKELKSKIVKNEDKILDFSNSRNAKSEFQEEESKSYDQISHSTSYNYNLSVEHSIQKKLNPNYIQSASSSSTTVQNLEPKSEDKNVLNLHKPQSIQDSFLASKSFASRPHSLPSTSSHSIPPPSHSAPPDASTPKKICSQAKSPVPLKTIPKQEPEQPQSDRVLETPRTLLSPHSPRHPPPPPPSETSLHDRSSSFFPQSVPSAPLNHPSVSLQSSYPITTTIPISTYSAHLIQKKHVSDNTPFGIHNDPMLHAKSSGKFSHSKQDDHTHKPFPSFATSVSQPSSYNYPPGYASGFYGKYSQGQSDPEMNYPQISISQFTAPESKKDTSYHRSISEYTSSVSSSNTTSVTSYESCYPNSSYSYYPSHSSSSSKTPMIQNIPVCHPSPFYSSSYPSVAGMYPPNHPNYLSLQQTPESAHCIKSSDSKSPSCTVSKATCHKNSNSYDDLKRFSSPPYSSNFSSMQGSSQNSYYSITKTTLESPRSSRSATPHSSISPSMSRNASPHHSKHSSPSLTKEPMNKQDSYMGESFTPINLSSESNNKSSSSSPLDSLKSSSQFVVLNKPTLTNQPPASHQYQSVSSASTNNYFYKPSPTAASGTPNKPYGSFPHYTAKPSESLSVGAKSPIPKTYASKSPTPGISYNSKSPVQSNLYHGMTHAHSLHSSKSGNALYRGKSPLPFSHPSEQLHSSPGNYQQLYQNPYYQDYQQRFYNNTDSSNLGSYSDFKKMKQDSQPSNYQTQKESSNNEMRSQPSFSMSGVSTNTTTINNYQNYASSYSNNYATPQNYIPQPTSSCQSPTVHSSQGLSSQQAYSKNFSGLGSNKFTYPTTTDHTSQIPPNYPPVSQSQRLSQKTQKSHLPVTTSSHQYPVSSQIPFSSHISNSSQSSLTHSTISNHQQKGASARPSSDPYPHPHPAHHYPTQISNHAHQSNFPGSIPAVSNHSQTSDPHCQVLESVSHHSSAPSSSYLYPNVSQQTFTSAQLPYSSSSKQSYSPSHLSYKNSSSLSHSAPSGSNQYTPNYKSLPVTPRTFQNDQTSSPPNSHQSSQAPLNHKLPLPPPPPSHQSRPPSTHQPLPPPSHHLPPPPSHHLPPPPSHQPPPPPSHQTPPKSHQPPPLRSHHLPPPPSHHPPPPPSHQLPPPPSHQPPPPPSHHGHPLQPPPPPSHHPPPPPSHHSSSRISSQHHFQSPSSTQSPQHQINNHSSSPSQEVKPLSFNQHASVGHHLHPSHHSYTHIQRTVDQNARSAPRPTNPLPSNHYPPSSAYSMYKHHSFKQNESGNSSAQSDNAVGHSQKSHRISSRNESPVHYKPFPTQPPQAHLSQPVPDSQNISVNSPYISAHSYHQPNNAQPNYKPSNSESLDGQNLHQNSNAKSPLSNYLAHHQSLPQGSYPQHLQRPPVQYHSSPYPSQSTSESTHSPYFPPGSSKANNSYSSHSKPPPLPSDVTTKSDKEVTSHDSAKQPASGSCTLNSKESSRQEASCVLKSKSPEEDRPPVAIPEEKYSSENDGQSKASEETQETGKAVLVEKLQKKLAKKDSDEKVNEDNKGSMKPVEVKVLTEEDELNEKFDKLMDDLSFHKDSITSKKSCILGRRYIQKVQLQYAVDNNEVIVPETYIEEEESESEREEPVKKFRGKFRSIKDKAVERVILTYASHSDESATEMIPDDDASDFEEELIKEIEAKARKNKGKGKNVKSRDSSFETKKKGDTQSKRKNLSKSKRDNEYTMSSSYNDSSSRGSSSSDDDSNSDDSSSTSGSSSSGFSIASKRRNMRRRKRRPQSSSNSDEDFLPQRKTRRSKKLSSEDETFKPPSHKSRRKGKRPMSRKLRKVKRKADLSDEESPQRNKSYKRGARVVVDDENSDSESAANDGSKQKRKRESLKLKILKNRTNISSSESEDDTKSSQTKRKSASDSDEIFTPSQSSSKKLMKIIDSESDSDKKLNLEPQKLDDEKTNDILENEKHLSQVIFLNNEELLQNNKDDSVLLKLSKIRDEELNRDDVLEMKNWTETASTEMKKLLEDLLETKWRHSWKKPTFYREDFKKGWQAEVKKYKMDVARIPKSLISTPPPPPQVINEADSSNSVSSAKKTKESSKKSKGKGSPAKNTRSKSGIVKTSLTLNENDRLKVAARPEISNVMERFFEKVLGDPVHLDSSKKLPAFGPFTPISRSPTGLTPTPSLALSMIASDDSDRDSLASLRTDLPASDSVPVAPRRRSIANSLIKKLRKKYKDKKIDSQLFNKSRSIMEPTNKPSLLPTPGLSVSTDDSKSPAKYDQLRLTTFFRKDSVSRYRETFDDAALKNGINEFTPILVPSRTRKKTKAILDAATIRAVFGADPSEIPSVSPKEKLIKEEQPKLKSNTLKKLILHQDNKRKEPTPSFAPSPIPSSVSHSSTPIDFLFNDDDDSEVRNEELVIIQGIRKSRKKIRKLRKRSGFDYIRKKKKAKPEEEIIQASKRKVPVRKRMIWPEENKDIANEIRNWVINKGLGETVLHKAARLQYHDVVIYCLESSDYNVNAKDNAGYTPLHEACNRGHLDIAQALCAHHAHVNASGFGGMRPLHEAIENGHIELARLLLAYGADPSLSTYGGQTCLALATDPQTERFINEFMCDLKGKRTQPWHIMGPSKIFDLTEQGSDVFADVPGFESDNSSAITAFSVKVKSEESNLEPKTAEPELDGKDISFESSEQLLPAVFSVKGRDGQYVLLRELLDHLSMTRKELIIAAGSIETLHLGSEDCDKKLRCLIIGYKVTLRPETRGHVTLVKYTSAVRRLLDVEVTQLS